MKPPVSLPLIILVGALAGMLFTKPGHSQTPSEQLSVEDRLKRLEAAMPGVGEVMSSVQLHFAKLYYSGEARNWKLASFEIEEIEENLNKAATLRPVDNGVQLNGVLQAFEQTQLAAMKEAVAGKNLGAFRKNYTESIVVCNSCHEATGRSFIIITKPASPPVTNQQ